MDSTQKKGRHERTLSCPWIFYFSRKREKLFFGKRKDSKVTARELHEEEEEDGEEWWWWCNLSVEFSP